MGILTGLRVLDITRYVAGPIATALLADLGADVIHIEPPGGGEDRRILPIDDEFHAGAGFTQCNRNKRGLALDLASDRGKEAFRRVLATSDVVVANLPQRAVRSLGLDYETLRSMKPDVIMLHLTTFGGKGPYADRLGFDAIAQVMCGLTHLSGEPGKPMKNAGAWVDMATGFLGAFGVLAALQHRMRTGEGQLVEANLLQTALTVSNYFLIEQHFNEYDREASGNRAQSGGPADLLPTKDGWVYAVALGDPMFKRFMSMIGCTDLIADPRFLTDELRAEHGADLTAIASQWSSSLSTEAALAELAANRIPAGPLLTPREAMLDPHIAGHILKDVDIEGLSRSTPFVRPPVTFSKTPGEIRQGPPRPGQDTRTILSECGLSDAEIETLLKDRVIST
jgi:crotonobetainyl-CoA:carnitine CoA-transferase CaiB-like acyl-CoA transferase